MPRVLSAVSQWCGLQAVWEGSIPFIGLSYVICPEVGHLLKLATLGWAELPQEVLSVGRQL